MSPDRYQRVRAIFHQVCERDPAEHDALLRQSCGDDHELLAEVRSLLDHHESDAGALGDSAIGFGRQLIGSDVVADELDAADGPLSDPTAIGRYRIVRRIGEGGMGTVYEAEQEQPVRRHVALKIIKLGMDSRQVVARFAQERQALALMDHPHIARVFDAGTTPTGRPFFAMELCGGESVTNYCDRNRLGIHERLELFLQICGAVQHAHQKGIIHRDIKPSNLLVALQDGQPHAKVIDFGIAKAVAERVEQLTLVTEAQQFLGTPEYMSPEQAAGSRDVDTRTDVYAMGVLLYELLTGCTPFGEQNLAQSSLPEVLRVICDVEPVRPSTRVRELTARADEVAVARGISSVRLLSLLRGDLDWIVTRAMEKDRARRYASAGALADDVSRYLAGDAVEAVPPSTAYRVSKFVRRNRGLVIGAGLVSAALISGAAGTLWQASVARREATAARAAENDARRIAEFQAEILQQIDTSTAGEQLIAEMRSQFQRGLEKTKPPPQVREMRIAEFEEQLRQLNATDLATALIDTTILKPSIESVGVQFADQPLVGAALYQTLARAYSTIGRFDAARAVQDKALETRRRLLGESHADTLDSMQALGFLMRVQGDLAGAQVHLNDTLAKCNAALGPDHPVTMATYSTCGGILRLQGKLAEAEACWREVLDRRRRVLGPDSRDTLISMNNLGLVLMDQGKLAEAETLLRESMERGRRVFGPDHPNSLITLNFLGGLLWRLNRFEEAEQIHRETLEKRLRVHGEYHPRTINSLANLAELLAASGKPAEAEPLLREAYERRRRVLGDEHLQTRKSAQNLADFLRTQGREAEAQTILDRLGAAPER